MNQYDQNESMSFNFNNQVGFSLSSADDRARTFFQEEYAYNLAAFEPDLRQVKLDWQKSGVSSDVILKAHSHKLLARWKYAIDLSPELITITARGNNFALPMVHHMLVHPSLRYLSSYSETLLLHGAALVHNGKSIIMTGQGGAGKTTTSSRLLQTGGSEWQLHADDYVFVSNHGKTYAYLTRSHLYLDILEWLPQLKNALTYKERIQLETYGRLRRYSREGLKWPVRLSAARIWPDHSLAPQAESGALLLLRRSDCKQANLSPINNVDEAVHELIEMNFYEARHFIALVNSGLTAPENPQWLPEWRAREQAILHQVISQSPALWLNLPDDQPASSASAMQLNRLLTELVE